MKITLKDFLLETDRFQEVVNSYLISTKIPVNKKSKNKKKQFQKVFDPKKWREYLQYVSSIN